MRSQRHGDQDRSAAGVTTATTVNPQQMSSDTLMNSMNHLNSDGFIMSCMLLQPSLLEASSARSIHARQVPLMKSLPSPPRLSSADIGRVAFDLHALNDRIRDQWLGGLRCAISPTVLKRVSPCSSPLFRLIAPWFPRPADSPPSSLSPECQMTHLSDGASVSSDIVVGKS